MKRSELKKIIREILLESPDKNVLAQDYSEKSSIPFYYVDNKMYIGFYTKGISKKYVTHYSIELFYLLSVNDNEKIPIDNKRFDFPNYDNSIRGRVFGDSHIITFWHYPDSQETLNKIISLIVNEFNILSTFIEAYNNSCVIKYIEVPKDLDYFKMLNSFPEIINDKIYNYKLIDINSYGKYLSETKF